MFVCSLRIGEVCGLCLENWQIVSWLRFSPTLVQLYDSAGSGRFPKRKRNLESRQAVVHRGFRVPIPKYAVDEVL